MTGSQRDMNRGKVSPFRTPKRLQIRQFGSSAVRQFGNLRNHHKPPRRSSRLALASTPSARRGSIDDLVAAGQEE
jgi:hypothetical protein